MKIGIVLHPYGEKKQTGLGEYIFELAKCLIESDKENEYVIFLKSGFDETPVFNGSNWQVKVLSWGNLWRDLGLFFAPRMDLYIFNTPMMPLFFKPGKSIVIALDFAYKYFSGDSLREKINNNILFWLNKISLWRADLIISISTATKDDILKFFGNKLDKKIKVIYPGFRNLSNFLEEKIEIVKPYFLFVGSIKQRKNVLNIVKAFDDFRRKHESDHKLVLVGKKSGAYYQEISDFIREKALEKEIIFMDYVKDENLVYLYKNAEAFIFPSMIEGFGFPILEAMSCNAPVITSNVSSVAEVAGDSAILVDPLNILEISEAMHQIVSDKKLRDDLIARGNERIKDFSWEKTTKEFLRIIKEIKRV